MKYKIFSAIVFLMGFSQVSHAALIHEYDLNGTLNDKFGGLALTSKGGELTATQYKFGINQGLQMNERLGPVYSIDMVFHFNEKYPVQTIVNLNDLKGNDGIVANEGVAYGIYGYSGVSAPGNFIGEDVRFTLTYNEKFAFSLYENGELLFSQGINTSHFSAQFPTFFQGVVGSLTGSGAVDYIRIYDTALTPSEVALLNPPAPVPSDIPEPTSVAIFGAGLGVLGFLRRSRRK